MIFLPQIALDLDITEDRLIEILDNCRIRYYRSGGMAFVSAPDAERVGFIYRNSINQPTQAPRPTPERLREGYLPHERTMLRLEHEDRFGPAKGDLP